ncbi:MAG: fused MFS/spermidine synthase [Acidobacteria bacterium]|nr:fused MFS/spermidine synthase [Acidobacteriota bacterium]MCK6684046.1 fused MFS/spermidine synthase [Thermoanaerobaculia bacterium]
MKSERRRKSPRILALSLADDPPVEIIHRRQTPLQEIIVADCPSERTRYLYSNQIDIIQGAMWLDSPADLVLEYNRNSLIGLAVLEGEVRSVLFAGLGAGSLSGFVHRLLPASAIEVVEVDCGIVETAHDYFGFPEEIPVHVADARAFLEAGRNRYDMIFLDCFIGPDIPEHLLTFECMNSLKRRLRPGGVAVANLQPVETNPLAPAVVETFQAVFPRVHLFSSLESANIILVAVRSPVRSAPPTLVPLARAFEKRMGINIGLLGTAQREFTWIPSSPPPAILRDS